MKPFYFGPEERALFGVYTAPANGTPRRGAVLICCPFGPEYMRSHRALRELSLQLALEGHHSLRFDYFGCGDSAGDADEATVEGWVHDVASAIEELRAVSGIDRVSIVGLRLGAALAALSAERSARLDRLVLWDPIVSGSAYLQELAERHRTFMLGRPRPSGWTEADPPDELLGAPISPALREGFVRLDLLGLQKMPATRVLVVSSEHQAEVDALCALFPRLGARLDHEQVSSPPLWLRQDSVERTLVPIDVVQRITSWLGAS